MVFDSVGGGQIALVSDAMAATGLGDGDYLLGPLNVTVLGGTARLREGGEMSERSHRGDACGHHDTDTGAVRAAVAADLTGANSVRSRRGYTKMTPWAFLPTLRLLPRPHFAR